MKKLTAIVLLFTVCLPLCACGKANTTPTQATEQPVQNITIMNFATPTAQEEAEVTFDNPIVILDNEYARVTITGKYAGLDDSKVYQVYGYKALVENKTSNMYLMIDIPNNISIDGFMLAHCKMKLNI